MVFNEGYIMKEYIFVAHEYLEGAGADIKGDDLQELINVCVKYCTVLSLTYWPGQESVREKFRKYELSEEESRPFAAVATWRTYNDDFTIITVNIFYRICPELIDEFLKMSDGRLTGWCRFEDENYPEDPSFFREDASIFFNPVVHEGEYFLSPRDDEDVSNIVCHPGWYVYTPDSAF